MITLAPTFEDRLRGVITRALQESYTSVSCADAIQTGNHYQSIVLGGSRTAGFRNDRSDLLDQIDFTGKRVLDLGSNLGELSRSARARGAALVDGIEYDPYFIEIANLVNAFNKVTGVSFFQGDITDPELYKQKYDIVLAFSVFQYVHRVIPQLAEITNELLILETHKLDGNLEQGYMIPLQPHFPFHRVLGESDWGAPFEQTESRAVLAFAKQREYLDSGLADARSDFATSRPDAPDAEIDVLDVSRTVLQRRFQDVWEWDDPADFWTAMRSLTVDSELLARSHDARLHGYSGWVYWFLYVKGWLEYSELGEVRPDNVYVRFLAGELGGATPDPLISRAIGSLEDSARFAARRFADMDTFQRASSGDGEPPDVTPLRLTVRPQRTRTGHRIWLKGAGRAVTAVRVDGWHRFFAAKVFGYAELPVEIVRESTLLPTIRGRVETASIEDGRLRLSGWLLDPEEPADAVEVWTADRQLAVVALEQRQDIAEAFPWIPHAGRTGFAVDTDVELPEGGVPEVVMIAVRDWLPLGQIVAGIPQGESWAEQPPERVTERYAAGAGRHAALLPAVAARLGRETLRPIGRYRRLDSFHRVLDWGCGWGLLEMSVREFLPHAHVLAVDADPEAIEWARPHQQTYVHYGVMARMPPLRLDDGAIDLVVAVNTLSHYEPSEQDQWLAELARVLEPGGYASLGIRGELAASLLPERPRRAIGADGVCRYQPTGAPTEVTIQGSGDIVERCRPWFEVVSYAVGGIDSEFDLLVARRR